MTRFRIFPSGFVLLVCSVITLISARHVLNRYNVATNSNSVNTLNSYCTSVRRMENTRFMDFCVLQCGKNNRNYG
jgi:hypothetical protein